jgi:hypothetical protein
LKSFWLLLGLAFVDLAVAGAMIGRGERGLALVFMVLAVLTAAVALFAKPELRRDPRGRLQAVEPAYARVLGVAGAVAILGAAAYVALSTGQAPSRPSRPAAEPTPWVAPAPAPGRTASPARANSGNWLYKCVDPSGHASFQSAPCASGSRQEWRRPVTPEPAPAGRNRSGYSSPSTTRQTPTYVYPVQPSRRQRKENSQACLAARAADARYRRQPLSRVTHDGLRRHGDAIRAACG